MSAEISQVLCATDNFGVLVHDLRDPLVDTPSEAWFSPLVTAAALAVGRVVHARRRQAEEKAWQLKNPEQMDSERLQQLDPSRSQLSLDAESRVHVHLSQFHGIELEEWPATIARTAMFLVEHQANQAVNLTLGYTVPMLPLQDSARITVANALRIDWNDVVPASESEEK